MHAIVDRICVNIISALYQYLFVSIVMAALFMLLYMECKKIGLYHKIFKSRDDMSVYLENMDPLISYDEELLNRLTNARNTDVGNWGQTPLG